MSETRYRLTLEERQTNFYTVTSPDLPKFEGEVTGCFVDEAILKAKRVIAEWVCHQRDVGNEVPTPTRGGITVFAEGAKKTDDGIFWSKRDLQRATGLSRSTIDRRVSDGTFKRLRIGRRVLFKPSQIRAALS